MVISFVASPDAVEKLTWLSELFFAGSPPFHPHSISAAIGGITAIDLLILIFSTSCKKHNYFLV